MQTIHIFGTGAMAQAMAAGLLAAGFGVVFVGRRTSGHLGEIAAKFPAARVEFYGESGGELARDCGGVGANSNLAGAGADVGGGANGTGGGGENCGENCADICENGGFYDIGGKFVIFAFKPHALGQVAARLRGQAAACVSVLARTSLATLKVAFGENIAENVAAHAAKNATANAAHPAAQKGADTGLGVRAAAPNSNLGGCAGGFGAGCAGGFGANGANDAGGAGGFGASDVGGAGARVFAVAMPNLAAAARKSITPFLCEVSAQTGADLGGDCAESLGANGANAENGACAGGDFVACADGVAAVELVLGAVGTAVRVASQSEFEAAGILAGCAPAYIALVAQALAAAAVRGGLAAHSADELALGAFESFAAMAHAATSATAAQNLVQNVANFAPQIAKTKTAQNAAPNSNLTSAQTFEKIASHTAKFEFDNAATQNPAQFSQSAAAQNLVQNVSNFAPQIAKTKTAQNAAPNSNLTSAQTFEKIAAHTAKFEFDNPAAQNPAQFSQFAAAKSAAAQPAQNPAPNLTPQNAPAQNAPQHAPAQTAAKIDFAALVQRICSPAGTTIEGVFELENAGVRGAFMRAFAASLAKQRG